MISSSIFFVLYPNGFDKDVLIISVYYICLLRLLSRFLFITKHKMRSSCNDWLLHISLFFFFYTENRALSFGMSVECIHVSQVVKTSF